MRAHTRGAWNREISGVGMGQRRRRRGRGSIETWRRFWLSAATVDIESRRIIVVTLKL